MADTETANVKTLDSKILEAVESGVSLVQLRAKELGTRDFFNLAVKMSKALIPYQVPFIINDRIDIAMACGADGVHLGQKDLPLVHARKLMGPDKLIGITANTIKQAQAAEQGGADYLGVGPIYFTDSKKDLNPVLGINGLKHISKKVQIPILAVGGIKPANVPDVIAAGADGIAVISAILGAQDITKATQLILAAIK